VDTRDADLKTSIELAVYREIGARNFYRRISETIKNPEGRGRFVQLSVDEEGHRVKLESWFEKLVGEKFAADEGKIEQSEIRGIDIGEQTGALEALNIAIEAEAQAREFYSDQAAKADIPELRKLFEELSEEESGHHDLLEAERNSIIGGFYWFDLDSTAFLED